MNLTSKRIGASILTHRAHALTSHGGRMIFFVDNHRRHRTLLLGLGTIYMKIHAAAGVLCIFYCELPWCRCLRTYRLFSCHTCRHEIEEHIPPLDDPLEATSATYSNCLCSSCRKLNFTLHSSTTTIPWVFLENDNTSRNLKLAFRTKKRDNDLDVLLTTLADSNLKVSYTVHTLHSEATKDSTTREMLTSPETVKVLLQNTTVKLNNALWCGIKIKFQSLVKLSTTMNPTAQIR